MAALAPIRISLAALMVSSFALATPAQAKHSAEERGPSVHNQPLPAAIDPYDTNFRQQHPMRLFVQIEASGKPRQEERFEAIATDQLEHSLPDYAVLVTHPHDADVMIKVTQNHYILDFRVVDTDRESKTYNKYAKHAMGRCGPLHKAYYTEIKEKGTGLCLL